VQPPSDSPRTREQRFAENEAVFRRANEQLVERVHEIAPTLEVTPLICECGEPRCTQIIALSSEEYRLVRAHPARFLIVPGHESGHDEKVVGGDGERFSVIEKAGEARRAIDEYERTAD
jgi:hypothetical protein